MEGGREEKGGGAANEAIEEGPAASTVGVKTLRNEAAISIHKWNAEKRQR